jgi:hypothetical protein
MILLAAAAIAASAPAPAPQTAPAQPVAATIRATASVRIISGTSISWAHGSADQPKIRLTQLRGSAGDSQPVRLIEFE